MRTRAALLAALQLLASSTPAAAADPAKVYATLGGPYGAVVKTRALLMLVCGLEGVAHTLDPLVRLRRAEAISGLVPLTQTELEALDHAATVLGIGYAEGARIGLAAGGDRQMLCDSAIRSANGYLGVAE